MCRAGLRGHAVERACEMAERKKVAHTLGMRLTRCDRERLDEDVVPECRLYDVSCCRNRKPNLRCRSCTPALAGTETCALCTQRFAPYKLDHLDENVVPEARLLPIMLVVLRHLRNALAAATIWRRKTVGYAPPVCARSTRFGCISLLCEAQMRIDTHFNCLVIIRKRQVVRTYLVRFHSSGWRMSMVPLSTEVAFVPPDIHTITADGVDAQTITASYPDTQLGPKLGWFATRNYTRRWSQL